MINTPSPLPLSTTLVSPVTIWTPQSAAARPSDAVMRRSVSMEKPSSMMNAALRNNGVAPPMARSFTVPCTASDPMSPPGKKSGFTTNESVVSAIRMLPSVSVA